MEEWLEGSGKDKSFGQSNSESTRYSNAQYISRTSLGIFPMYQTLVRPKHRVLETLVFDRLSESVSRDGRVELPVTDAEPH